MRMDSFGGDAGTNGPNPFGRGGNPHGLLTGGGGPHLMLKSLSLSDVIFGEKRGWPDFVCRARPSREAMFSF